MAERVRMTRHKPWRHHHPDAVIVDRRTRWGNPWTAQECAIGGKGGRELAAAYFQQAMTERVADEANGHDPYAHERPDWYPTLDVIRAELAGKDLACWCAPSEPCHADVLLAIANEEVRHG